MKPESGACCQLFFLIFTVAVAYSEAEGGAPGWGMPSIGASAGKGVLGGVRGVGPWGVHGGGGVLGRGEAGGGVLGRGGGGGASERGN